LFNWWEIFEFSIELSEKGDTDIAVDVLQLAIKNSAKITEVPPIIIRVLSNVYVMQCDWQTTVDVLEKLLKIGRNKKSANAWTHAWHALKLVVNIIF
jgi:hypothetical protein